jgi:hypothetical protein
MMRVSAPSPTRRNMLQPRIESYYARETMRIRRKTEWQEIARRFAFRTAHLSPNSTLKRMSGMRRKGFPRFRALHGKSYVEEPAL